jgi:hypothetical protein
MKISDAFSGISKVFLDTAPVVYYVEETPVFGEVVWEVFNCSLKIVYWLWRRL